MIDRPDWYSPTYTEHIDLSKNVHYDSMINEIAKKHLCNIGLFHNYPSHNGVYNAISRYYKIPIKNLMIGFGATDVIERLIRFLNFNTLYIIEPAFEMVKIYCQINNVCYRMITYEQALSMGDENGVVYIANPNGNNGKIYNTSILTRRFKYCIIDEVYADFDDRYSLLHHTPDNVVVVKSISKSLGMAGLRVGFMKASENIINHMQQMRMNYSTCSVTDYLLPKLIEHTPMVIQRMLETREYLESKFPCVKSHGNYVLFYNPNEYTGRFGAKLVNGLYRMALADMETLNG